MIFNDPLPVLEELDISFYSPDGTIYDFNGLDHAFMLEVTTLTKTPVETGISSKIGQ